MGNIKQVREIRSYVAIIHSGRRFLQLGTFSKMHFFFFLQLHFRHFGRFDWATDRPRAARWPFCAIKFYCFAVCHHFFSPSSSLSFALSGALYTYAVYTTYICV